MDFIKALNSNDHIFDSILEIMKIGRNNSEVIDSARDFLKVINLIIDYYTNRDDDELKISVVYFPICNNNSQELCEEFIALKLGIFINNEYLQELNEFFSGPLFWRQPGLHSEREIRFERDHLSRIIQATTMEPDINLGKSLVFSENMIERYGLYKKALRSRRYNGDEFWYVSRAINEDYRRYTNSPLSLIRDTFEPFYERIIQLEDSELKNFVFFPCRSADGNYSQFCADTIQRAYLDDFVNAGNGLRNVFVFRFSRKPYRLRRLYDIKKITQEQISDDSIDFITFNYEEAEILFKRKKPAIKKVIIRSEIEAEKLYEPLFDNIIACLDKNYVLRCNESSLCITPELKEYYTKKLSSESEIDDTLLEQILKINIGLWENNTGTYLYHFLNKKDVCVILANSVDDCIQEHLREWFQNRYSIEEVVFKTFSDLKGYLDNNEGTYKNRINNKRILILSFRNDYTNSIFHKYPNSFDPLCVNSDQKVLVIENHFIMGQYFDKGWNKYCKATKIILRSVFRTDILKPILGKTIESTREIIEDTYDEMNDRNTRSTMPQSRITFADNSQKLFARSEWMLYSDKNNRLFILPLSDLADIYSSYTEGISVQPMSQLVSIVYDNFIEIERERDKENERIFKENSIYGLTPIEINNELPLWKILLKKKFEELTPKAVYKQIMTTGLKVDYSVFLKWPNKDYGLPRSNKLQERLIRDYLKIKDPYLKLERRIKERNRDNTESINTSIRLFLSQALVSNNYSVILHKTNEETRELLGIESANDIKRIVTFVRENIKLEPIKTITL